MKQTPIIRHDMLTWQEHDDGARTTIAVGSHGWFTWLATARVFIVAEPSNRFTARKEERAGGSYWYAYRRIRGKLRRLYLGKDADLTVQRLHQAAQSLIDRGRIAAVVVKQPQRQQVSDGRGEILSTKLAIPPLRPTHIARPDALARLRHAVDYPLTLLSAPAGYGKTTLLAQWAATASSPLAWVALDPQDATPTRFWSYILTALDPLVPGLLSLMLPTVQTPNLHLDPDELAVLINLLAAAPDPIMLVLDDYDAIGHDARDIHDALIFIVEHLPPNAHIVLASRSDPPLPLARLRTRQQLNEITVTDLRFTRDEAAHFLTQSLGQAIAPREIATLYAHIEGWAIGWQLAALTLQGHEDIAALAESFTGKNHYIIEYLTAEVLNYLPPEQLQFLLQTAILHRLTASLCDAVTLASTSQAMIDALERANLFVIALDEDRHWYRYHSVFADALNVILRQQYPERISELYHRASRWCEHQGYINDAVNYAFEEDDLANVTQVIENSAASMLGHEGITNLSHWMQRLPEAIIRSHPRLSLAQAYIMLFAGQVNGFERWVSGIESAWGLQLRHPESQMLEREIMALSATAAALRGHQIQCAALCRNVQAALPAMPTSAFQVMLSLGMAHWLNGDVPAAAQQLDDLRRQSLRQSNQFYFCNSVALLAHIFIQQGRLHPALELCENARSQFIEADMGGTEISAIGVSQGMALWAYNKLDQATTLLEQNVDHTTSLLVQAEGHCALANIYQTQGRVTQAAQMIERALAATQAEPLLTTLIRAHQTWLWTRQGDVVAATDWARDHAHTIDVYAHARARPLYVQEWEQLVLARVYLAQQQTAAALTLLDVLCEASADAGRLCRTLDALVLQAVAHDARSDTQRAFVMLHRALEIAQPEGNVRPFIDSGTTLRQMLVALVTSPSLSANAKPAESMIAFIHTVLQGFDSRAGSEAPRANMSAHAARQLQPNPVVTALSRREKEVLHSLANGASNHDLARELVIEMGTVKRHLSNIYTKLGVQSRSQAIARAHVMHLLEA